MKQQTKLSVLIIILLIALASYVAYDKYSEYLDKKEAELIQEVTQSIIINLIEQAVKCEPITFTLDEQGNEINLIAIECLQQEQNAQSPIN